MTVMERVHGEVNTNKVCLTIHVPFFCFFQNSSKIKKSGVPYFIIININIGNILNFLKPIIFIILDEFWLIKTKTKTLGPVL